MHLAERTILRIIKLMRECMPCIDDRNPPPQKEFFALYYRRMIELCESAILLSRQTDYLSSASILMRSALECAVDLENLARFDQYYLVLEAIELANRYEMFKYKADPVYPALLNEMGRIRADEAEASLKQALKHTLQRATKAFPILENAVHKLNVLNRFRIAGKEEVYQTQYATLSMATHNALSMLTLRQELDLDGLPQMEHLFDAEICNVAMEHLVNAIKWESLLFGTDETLVRGVIQQLRSLQDATPKTV